MVALAVMNSKSSNHRKCAHCGRRFRVDPRVGRHHRFCSRPVCAKISRATAQRRWLEREKQREVESKADVYRMQDWRKAHPGYWRRKTQVGRYILRGELANVAREFALQDMIDTHFSLVVGLVSYLTRSALQDTIASELRRLMLRGHGILSQTTKAAAASPGSDQK